MTRGDLVSQTALASESNVQIRHKNTGAIGPDKFPITSTHHGDRTTILGREISNKNRFALIFPCARLFWRLRPLERDCNHAKISADKNLPGKFSLSTEVCENVFEERLKIEEMTVDESLSKS